MALVETVGREWTVMTWNIQGRKPTDLDRVCDVIASEAPDVVVLQEARLPQAKALARALDWAYEWHEKHHPLRPLFPGRAEGAAVLTPHALRDAEHARISDETSKRSYRRRIVQWAIIERADRSAHRMFNAHLSPHDMSEQRRNEATRIAELVAQFGDRPAPIVAGDFNDKDSPEIVAILPGTEILTPPPTNPSERPTNVLDHVLLPASSRDVSVSVPGGGPDWAELSDHLPLTVRFTLHGLQDGFAS